MKETDTDTYHTYIQQADLEEMSQKLLAGLPGTWTSPNMCFSNQPVFPKWNLTFLSLQYFMFISAATDLFI